MKEGDNEWITFFLFNTMIKIEKETHPMFNNSRFRTAAINSSVNLEIQLSLWRLIDDCKANKINLDYLQIFILSVEIINGKKIQKITHTQEKSPFCFINIIERIEYPIDNLTIWVIDDGDNSTMLFPSDY